jgi:endo-1,4-beta-xylanase
MMFRLPVALAALAVVSGAVAGVLEARQAIADLERRQNSGTTLNSVQNWSNDYAGVDFETGDNGEFTVDWNNPPGGNFVVGRGYQPGGNLYVWALKRT